MGQKELLDKRKSRDGKARFILLLPDNGESVLHNWRKEILEQLMALQNSEGFWVNENARWCENQKVLVTAYTIIAMEHALGK